MKKLAALLIVCSLFLLAGCGDASAELSDKKTVLFSLGKTKVTKQDFYNEMLKADKGMSVVNLATSYIVDKEVTTTPAMEAEAQKQLDDYKEELGEKFEESVISAGYASVDEFYNFLLNNVKSDHLSEAYIDNNWDALVKEYSPKKARIMCFNTSDSVTLDDCRAKAQAAIEEVRGGASFATVAAKYGSDSSLANEKLYTSKDTALDVNVAQVISTATAPTVSDVTVNSSASSCYVVQITVTNDQQLKEDFVEYLKKQSSFSDNINKFYFEKYGFRVYDITTYNLLKENYSNYLVQD